MIRIGKEKNSYDNNQINQTFSMEILQTFLMPSAWLALLTLTFLEIVLGIDNIVFLSIMSTKVPPQSTGTCPYRGFITGDAGKDRTTFRYFFTHAVNQAYFFF